MTNLLRMLAGIAIIVLISGALGYTFGGDRSALAPPSVVSWPESYPATPETISLTELKAGLDGASKVVLLDARMAAEFEAGHIRGALNLPASQFEVRYPELRDRLPSDADLVVYCSGTNCGLDVRLAELLIGQGRGRVKVLSGGWSAWLEAGYPEESGQSK